MTSYESKPNEEKKVFLDIYEDLHTMTPEAREVVRGVVREYAKMYPAMEGEKRGPLLRLVGAPGWKLSA